MRERAGANEVWEFRTRSRSERRSERAEGRFALRLTVRLRAFGTIAVLLPKQDGICIAPGGSEDGLASSVCAGDMGPVHVSGREREACRFGRRQERKTPEDIG
jgi:hypothetical protein